MSFDEKVVRPWPDQPDWVLCSCVKYRKTRRVAATEDKEALYALFDFFCSLFVTILSNRSLQELSGELL